MAIIQLSFLDSKVCTKCGEWKSLSEYYISRNTQRPDCKKWVVSRVTVYQQDSEKYRAYYEKREAQKRQKNAERAVEIRKAIAARKSQPDITCIVCGICKPREDFHTDKGKSFGVRKKCKACRNAEYDAEERRMHYRANRIYLLKRNKAYREQNKDKRKEYRKRTIAQILYRNEVRRARQLGADGQYTQNEWQALCDWFGGRCLRCGAEKLTVDHVIPIVKGGTNYIDNLQPLCGVCNSSKGSSNTDYRDPSRLAAFLESLKGQPDA